MRQNLNLQLTLGRQTILEEVAVMAGGTDIKPLKIWVPQDLNQTSKFIF